LQKLGVKADTLVGICVERSLEMMVGLLGILKAGGAYVPLDPEYPQERLSFMLEDSQVEVLLTQNKLVKLLAQNQEYIVCLDSDWQNISQTNQNNLNITVTPNNLAYVIYTSGSTGQPKGVYCNHLGVVNLYTDFQTKKPLCVGDRCSLWTSLNFDVSIYEVFSALLSGATLHITPELIRSDASKFINWLYSEQISSAYIPPFMLNNFSDYLEQAVNHISLRRLLVGVEPINEKLLISISQRIPELQIINGYGPTETTICSTLYLIKTERSSNGNTPIGKPLQNTKIYLLDNQMQPVPIGVQGELHIGGAGLALGYLNRPQLNAEKFIPNPFDKAKGSKLYKTGDLARYLPDGNIEYLGRIDNQVKIRGFRIELGEIEALLASHPQIWETVVLVWDDTTGDKRLVAYIVPQPEITIIIDEIRQFLKAKLPDYMVPNAFVILAALPLTANGKIDRRALPPPESGSEASDKYVAPRTPMEEILATIWSEVLKVEKVGINDNFFELGGHSLLATQLVAQIRDRLEIELPLRQLFNSATLAELAQEIEQLKQKKSAPIVPAILPRKRK
jgi:amino acid adenylation domain-containing protein